MYQYEFEKISYEYSFFGGLGVEMAQHRELIRRRAEDGWRYVGCIPRSQTSHGFVEEMDLVFERAAEE